MHSTTCSTVHSRPFNSLEHCICTTTTTNILPDRDSNLIPPGYKPQSIRMSHQGRPVISKARKIKNSAIVFPSNKKSSLCLKYWGSYDNFCYNVMVSCVYHIPWYRKHVVWWNKLVSTQLLTSTCQPQWFHGHHYDFCMIMMSNKCIVCFIACLDTENIWSGEIILSLSELLSKIWSLE